MWMCKIEYGEMLLDESNSQCEVLFKIRYFNNKLMKSTNFCDN